MRIRPGRTPRRGNVVKAEGREGDFLLTGEKGGTGNIAAVMIDQFLRKRDVAGQPAGPAI